MTGTTLKRLMAVALLSSGAAMTSLGVGAGTAAADAFGNHQWCPGQSLPRSDAPINWDMGTCHDYHYVGAWTVVEGVRPNPCPPIAFMCP
ncbi:hypothetical protein [Mycobacterium sp. 050134]|uniref:hypothetical protein n=1 Tax=Mycobacterium sp. 050134 TaxID=3096111 RepID=UPI002EDB4722